MAARLIHISLPGTARETLGYPDIFGGDLFLPSYGDLGSADGAPIVVAHGVSDGGVVLAVGGSTSDPVAPKPWGASDGQVTDRHDHWLTGCEAAA